MCVVEAAAAVEAAAVVVQVKLLPATFLAVAGGIHSLWIFCDFRAEGWHLISARINGADAT
jgi:hypothetical protein